MATATARAATPAAALPPGPGAGRLAQAVRFNRDPLRFLRDARHEYGDTFTLRLAVAGPMVTFADPEAIDEVVELPREAGDAGAARRRIVQMISEHSVLGADQEEHRVIRERLEPPFDARTLDPRREAMTRIAEEHIERWPVGRPFRVLPRMRLIADEIFARLVLGMSGERAQALASATYRMLWTPGNPPLSPPGRYAGLLGALGTKLFDRRKQPVARILAEEIDARRRVDGGAAAGSMDVIGAAVRATPDKPTAAMVDELLPLLMAGQEPAASGLTWILDRLARNAELAANFLRSAPDDPLRTATVREALRLRPAVHTVARRLTEPRAVGGCDLPAGAVVAVPIVLVHRDPAAFPDPDAFRPERFLGEDLESLPYLPFGGGPRRCLGRWLARAEIGTVVPAILRRLDLKPLSRQPERMVVRGTVLVPRHGELAVARRR